MGAPSGYTKTIDGAPCRRMRAAQPRARRAGRSRSLARARSGLVPEQLIAHAHHVARLDLAIGAHAYEGAVGGAEILETRARADAFDRGVTARHELVVGEGDVALLAPEDQLRPRQVPHVA